MIELKPHTSAADVAYMLMKNDAKAMATYELIDAVIEIMNLPENDAATKAKVYTSINLDPRLVCLDKGTWGIRDWSPTAIAAATSMPDLLPGEKSYQPKADDYLWDDDDDDADDDAETVPAADEDPEEPMLQFRA